MSDITGKIKKAFRLLIYKHANIKHVAGTSVDENKVLFISNATSEMKENMLEVYSQAVKRGYNCNVICKNIQTENVSRTDVINISREIATSKYIFLDDVLDYLEFSKLRQEQEVIQLWHACGAYKMFGFVRPDGVEGKVRISKGHQSYTKAIVSAEQIRECYAKAFDIAIEKVIATGIPRTDYFFEEGIASKCRKELEQRFPELVGKKIVLFAPTYRGNRITDATYDYSQLDLDNLKLQLGNEYVFVFNWHPAVKGNISKGADYPYSKHVGDGFYFDLSDCGINQLMLASDILVTDYSSIIFEYLLTKKPVVFFTYDLEDYADSRGLFFPFEEYAYGRIASNQEDLVCAIKQHDMMTDKRHSFKEKFMSSCDGHSTERVCECVFQDKKI